MRLITHSVMIVAFNPIPTNGSKDIITWSEELVEDLDENFEEYVLKSKSEWVPAPLDNGWTGSVRSRVNDLGQTEVEINVTAGVVVSQTNVCRLQEHSDILQSTPVPLMNNTTGRVIVAASLNKNGLFSIHGNEFTTGQNYVGTIIL